MADRYRAGDHDIVDDKTGFKTRASKARTEWNGLLTEKKFWEPRQPQDFVRGRLDRQTVPNPRPRLVDTFIGPLTTEINATATAGATSVTVLATARMAVGDAITIGLDNNEMHLTTIGSVVSSTSITIDDALPWATSAGKVVIDNTAMAEPDIG